MNIHKSFKNQAGFTLSESIIAIMLIVVTLTSILTLINRAGGFMTIAFSRLIASNLSQEGIEIVRNSRDNNWIAGDSWSAELSCGEKPMRADYIDGLSCLAVDSEAVLLFDQNTGYNHTIGEPTIYSRRIRTTINGPEIKVESIVNWSMRGTDYETIAEDHLYNWY